MIYYIPGWLFKGEIFKYFAYLSGSNVCLDYYNLPTQNIYEICSLLKTMIADHSILVGWSLGGLISIKIAALWPEKVKKLILFASQPRFLADKSWSGISQKQADYFASLGRLNPFKLNSYYLSLVNYPNRCSLNKEFIENNILKSIDYGELLKFIFTADLREEYQSIYQPILHICGEKDAIINQTIVYDSLSLLNKNSTIKLIQKAGHTGFITHPQIYQKILQEFIHHE